jgi:hypothetical protein
MFLIERKNVYGFTRSRVWKRKGTSLDTNSPSEQIGDSGDCAVFQRVNALTRERVNAQSLDFGA